MYRFLIVDDNENDALQLSFLIEQDYSSQAKCEHASSQKDALVWLDTRKHQSFDAILLDLNLGDSEGIETFRAVRAAVPHTPIVVYSGRDDNRGMRNLLIDEGAEGYITKGRVKVVDVFQALYDAARRGKLTTRMDPDERQILAEAESRTLALVQHSRRSDPPESSALLLAEAFAAQMRAGNNAYKAVLDLRATVRALDSRVGEAENLSDTAKRKAVSVEEATAVLMEKHSEVLVEQEKLKAKDIELEAMAKGNKKKLAAIASGATVLGYVFGEGREWIFDLFAKLLG